MGQSPLAPSAIRAHSQTFIGTNRMVDVSELKAISLKECPLSLVLKCLFCVAKTVLSPSSAPALAP
jgi:hypothetical protein